MLRWVRDESVYEVWRALSELELGDAGADEITDVVSCPGTDSCKLGITSSMGLNQAVQERLVAMDIDDRADPADPHQDERLPERLQPAPHRRHRLLRGLDQGRRASTIPAYIPHIGGAYEGGEVRYGQRLKARLPAKRVPEAVERWVRFYESERSRRRAVQGVRRPRRHCANSSSR